MQWVLAKEKKGTILRFSHSRNTDILEKDIVCDEKCLIKQRTLSSFLTKKVIVGQIHNKNSISY